MTCGSTARESPAAWCGTSVGTPDPVEPPTNMPSSCASPASPIYLWHHLALKLLLNTMSAASIGILGRIRGNHMRAK